MKALQIQPGGNDKNSGPKLTYKAKQASGVYKIQKKTNSQHHMGDRCVYTPDRPTHIQGQVSVYTTNDYTPEEANNIRQVRVYTREPLSESPEHEFQHVRSYNKARPKPRLDASKYLRAIRTMHRPSDNIKLTCLHVARFSIQLHTTCGTSSKATFVGSTSAALQRSRPRAQPTSSAATPNKK